MKLISDIWQVLDTKSKVTILLLQIFVISISIFETLSIIIVAPFMGLVAGTFSIPDNQILNYLFINVSIGQDKFIFYFGCVVLVFFIFTNLFNIFSLYFINYFSNRIGAKISSNLYRTYISRPYEFHIDSNSADIASKISYDSDRAYTLIKRLLQSISEIIKCFFIISALIFYNTKVAISLSLVFFLIYITIYLFLEKKLKKNGKILSENNSYILKTIQVGMGAIKDIIILKRYNFFTKNFLKYRMNFSNLNAFNQTSAVIPRNIVEMFAFTIIISLILINLDKGSNINNSIPILAVFGLASYKLLPSFQNIYFNLSVIKSSQESFYNIRDDLRDDQGINIDYEKLEKLKFKEDLSLKHVCWKYKSSDRDVLKDININIKPNTIIGIVGESGSGKTTLGNIILGLLIPKYGQFSIDGSIINLTNVNQWQKNISFVPQNIFLMEGTIKENILLGEKSNLYSKQKLINALKLADLDQFIEKSKYGIDTKVGERGLSLSGGQLQRVGIARALYHDNEVLFFDEATSSLDGLSENKIIKSIKNMRNKTLFIISHNFNAIKNCDKIIFLKDGKILAQGTYTELQKKSAEFAKLAASSE